MNLSKSAGSILAGCFATKPTALVASGDRDTFQLASETTTILYPLRAREMARIGPAQVRERYGVDPKRHKMVQVNKDQAASHRLPATTSAACHRLMEPHAEKRLLRKANNRSALSAVSRPMSDK